MLPSGLNVLNVVPSRTRALTKSRSKSASRSKSTQGVAQVGWRQGQASPRGSVAKRKHRQDKVLPSRVSPRWNDSKARWPQRHSPIPMGRKYHGGGDAVGRPLTPDNQGIVIKRRKRWLQGHSDSTNVGQPDSWSTPAAPETPLGQIRLKERVTPRVARCRIREEGRYTLKVSD